MMNGINILEYLALKELGIMEHNMFMAGTPLCMDKKEKQIKITFEEMQERNNKRIYDEIDKVYQKDKLFCKTVKKVPSITQYQIDQALKVLEDMESGAKACKQMQDIAESIGVMPIRTEKPTVEDFITEQENLMQEKGMKFERVYENGNFVGLEIKVDRSKGTWDNELSITPNSSLQALEDYKNFLKKMEIDPNVSIHKIARAIIDGTPMPLVEKGIGHGTLQDNIEFLKKEEARVIPEDMWDEIFNMNKEERKDMTKKAENRHVSGLDDYKLGDPSKLGYCHTEIRATQPMKSKAQMDIDIENAKKEISRIREGAPNFIDPTKGAKLDDSKLPLSVVIQRQFPNALKAVAECSQYGNKKYHETDKDWCNLHRVDNGVERYSNAMMRHFLAAGKELDQKDNESNLPHIYHAAWNMLSLLQIIEQQKQNK